LFDREYFSLAQYTIGGGTTFSCHLMHKLGRKYILRIGKRLENKSRYFGYNIFYQNVPLDFIDNVKRPFVTDMFRKFQVLPKLERENVTIVIHDPQELFSIVIPYLKGWKIVNIRKTVQDWFKKTYDIKTNFLWHPFYEYPKLESNDKTKYVSISRIDFDKHTDIIVDANTLLKIDNLPEIEIYGTHNSIYTYHKLGFNKFHEYPNYKGPFDKDFQSLNKILSPSKVVVDMSAIKEDGGGTQYTFLEAIYNNCGLILNKKWTESPHADFIDGYNCIAVGTGKELYEKIKEIESGRIDIIPMIENSKKLMERHTNVDWSQI